MGEIKGDIPSVKYQEIEQKMVEQMSSIGKTGSSDPDKLYQELISNVCKYHPSSDITMIEHAYELANNAHKDQKRKSGEPYIIHPLSVAIILSDLQMDKETIAAGLLHDVVEDTSFTKEQIQGWFGEDVALLVDGVTKLSQLSYDQDKLEIQAESLRKMFLAMAKDIRVILIKLADRLHNMRTLKYMRPEKQKEIARETMDIYAPIAQRLGISKIKIELDDLSLKYLEPDVYYDLVEKIQVRKSVREEYIQELVDDVSGYITEAGIKAEIDGRVKHFFSIYKKMVNQDKTLEQIYDLFAIRIIVDNVKDCYAALGVIHEMYKPIPGRFKDYIAMPKPNRYQSLHTTLIGKSGTPFEIQIRTYEMHRVAEYGVAAHWKYKEVANGLGDNLKGQEEKMSWLRQILEWQKDMSDNKEFMSLLKSDLDLFSDTVFCFTPTGDVKNLPTGSTPIDFAYSIHSAVGNQMIGAKVNGKLVPIDYVVQNGDRIEVLTSQNSKGPSRDWLKVVKSSQAKNKINQWFKSELKEENIARGKDLLETYCKNKAIDMTVISKAELKNKVMKKYGFKDWDSLLASLGHGGLKEGQVVNKMLEIQRAETAANITDADILENIANIDTNRSNLKSKSGIVVKGIHDVAVRFSKCCSPVPGDEIVGYVTRGRGVSIHRTDCINMISLSEFEKARLIDAEWEGGVDYGHYAAEINIYGNNRRGLLVDVTRIFTERNVDILSVHTRVGKNGVATISLAFDVKDREELDSVIAKIRQVESVIDIERTRG